MRLIISIILIFSTLNSFSQVLDKPSEGKVLVYITRSNDLGGAMNFRVYDKDLFLGALPSRAYFKYECEPGEHLFWAASENRDFVEANLEANKTYVIDLRAKLGMFIAAVGVEPYSPDNKRHVKRVNKVLKKHISANIVDSRKTEEKVENIAKAMEAYERVKSRQANKIKKLLPNMNFKNTDSDE
ncbi:hypothetical protein BTO05_09420 [Winogradskyella sp. PC-19]|uniref:hypothetical protein n=1 Tax=unclassified Winogradskyella TaxID=2615021 RepID=UPI000B3D4CB9|nr:MULTISPECIES: hypothetical protein [unclassified Winogradskyella]ARV09850.1 hypothetical protein BTO05_09420 [Winogradskyella sp. PC-19]